MNKQNGMTLVELMVSMTVILIVMGGASAAYLKLLGGYKTQGKIAESYMENVTALELLRFDIEMAGYGLPWGMGGSTYANEAASNTAYTPNPITFNDAPNGDPRPFVFSPNGSINANNSDVLVIKSQVASPTVTTEKKWGMMYEIGGNWVVNRWSNADLDFQNGDRVIVLSAGYDDASKTAPKILQNKGAASWFFTFNNPGFYTNAGALPQPGTNEVHLLYGILPSSNPSTPQMPFNRTDYFLARPADFPRRCFPSSYTLYRSTIDHGTRQRIDTPVLDCVQDFQVAFGRDNDGDGFIDADWTAGPGSDVATIRKYLREVRVFILYHEGQRDDNFRFSGGLTLGDANTGNLSTFNPAGVAGAVNYRWKILKMAINPMNLR